MSKLSFKQKVRLNLIKSATAYSYYLDKRVIVKIPRTNRIYKLRFLERNFLHLTGVRSTINAFIFFKKCISKNIDENDFYYVSKLNMKLIEIKIRNLKNINHFFDNKVNVQENFSKGSIKCTIASSDGKCTLGFIKIDKNKSLPITLLDKNHLDKNKKIYLVKAKICTLNKTMLLLKSQRDGRR